MLRIILVLLLLIAAACAQAAPASAPQAPDAQQIARQFGPSFQAVSGIPALTADLEGDGAEDAVVVATSENPLLDQAEFHYRVVDPYDAAFGFGDPRITAQFSAQEPHPRLLLVVHNWRAPQQRFVIINVPFDKVSIARVLVKKKTVRAIRAEETAGMKSDLYWDGKKWKWQDAGIE